MLQYLIAQLRRRCSTGSSWWPGPGMDALAKVAAPHSIGRAEQSGWGPRMPHCRPRRCSGTGEVAVLYADNPLIRPDTLRRLVAARRGSGVGDAGDAAGVIPGRYGRVMAWKAGAVDAHRGVGGCDGGGAGGAAVQCRGVLRFGRRIWSGGCEGCGQCREGGVLPDGLRGGGGGRGRAGVGGGGG